jgi:hypothetical protein
MYPSLFYYEGACNQREAVKPCNNPVSLNDHRTHTVP